MAYVPYYAELTYENKTVRMVGESEGTLTSGLIITPGGIEGWYGTPDLKVDVTERGQGNGAHDVDEASILYSARTVTTNLSAIGNSREDVQNAFRPIQAAAGHNVKFRVVDSRTDTYVLGHISSEVSPEWIEWGNVVTLTVVCPRPERLSTVTRVASMGSDTGDGGGLVFDTVDDVRYLHLTDLSFGPGAIRLSNACTISNTGTSTAYPVITASGDMPGGLVITNGATGGQLGYGQPVRWQPVTFDSRSRTASVAGVDVSRALTSRVFPTIPAGGSISLSRRTDGKGVVRVESHDTYI